MPNKLLASLLPRDPMLEAALYEREDNRAANAEIPMPPVRVPSMFSGRNVFERDPTDSLGLDNPWTEVIPRALAQEPAPAGSAPKGMTVSGPTNWAAERERFLSRGSSPEIGQMADRRALDAEIESNALSGRRPDLLAEMQGRLAMEGLRNARAREAQTLQRGAMDLTMMDPAYRRQQRREDAISDAETYLDPTMAEQRGAEITHDAARREAIERVAIMIGMDPNKLAQIAADHQRKLELTRAGSPFGAFMGGGAQPQGQAPAAAGAPIPSRRVTVEDIRRGVMQRGGTEEDVLRIVQEASTRGVLVQ